MNNTIFTGILAVIALTVVSYLMYDSFGEPALMKRVTSIYKTLDSNADGKLDAAELDAAKQRLLELDSDGDGAISAEELAEG